MATNKSGIGVVTSITPMNLEMVSRKIGKAIRRVDGEININPEDRDSYDGYREALLDVYNLVNYGMRPVNNSRYGPYRNKGDWWI